MKLLPILFICATSFTANAQTKKPTPPPTNKVDKIKKDSINDTELLIKSAGDTVAYFNGKVKIIMNNKDSVKQPKKIALSTKSDKKLKNVETHWGGIDLGFNNYIDLTNYADIQNINAYFNGFSPKKSDFELKTGKSIHINFSIFKQQINLYKHHVNLVYGLTYDINNYRYQNSIHWNHNGADYFNLAENYFTKDTFSYSKNKLVTNYLQVPILLKFKTNPTHQKRNVDITIGGYAGYLVRSHSKQIIDNKSSMRKEFDNFDVNTFQYGTQFELGFRDITVYFKRNLSKLTNSYLEQYPYAFGVRLLGN